MTAAPAPARRCGRQRSKAADDAILAATLELLRVHGYAGLRMSAVIERAGVSSATLYRRWTAKHELVAAAVAALAPEPIDTDTGSLASDVDAFLRHVGRSMTERDEAVAEVLALEARRDPDLAAALAEKFRAPRLAELKGILSRAAARGELPSSPPPDVALSLLTGPVYHRVFVLREPITPAFLRRAVAHAVAGLQAR